MTGTEDPDPRSFFDRLTEPLADRARERLNQAEDKVRSAIQAEIDAVGAGFRARAVQVRPSAIAFGTAALVTFFGLALLVTAAVLGLVQANLQPWFAALLLGIALVLIGGGAAAWGKSRLPQSAPRATEPAHPAGDQVHPWDN